MKWFNIFKLYNFKILKKEKLIIIFTSLSILITTLISLIVPQITTNMKEYMYSSIKKLNGADLLIQGQYPSIKFNTELEKLKSEGLSITYKGIVNSYFKSVSGRKTLGKIIYGDNTIGKNQIILSKNLASSMNISVGDKIEIESSTTGVGKYTVKEIEDMPYGVDGDSKVLGYGKIDSDNSAYDISRENSYLVFIDGMDGEKLKNKLMNIEDGFVYTSLKDREKSVQGDVDNQILSFSLITTMGYILSIITIITTTIMIILRRKHDFAILKLLSIKTNVLKKSMFLEMALIITIPIIIATILSFPISTIIIKLTNYIPIIDIDKRLLIILKGFIFNLFLFFIFLDISLNIFKSIKALSIIREDEIEMKKIQKKIVVRSILLLPVMLFIYAIYVGRLSTFIGAILILVFIALFLVLVMILLKLVKSIRFKNSVLIYGVNSIKKNYTSFVLIVLSVTMTIVFMLVGFTLDRMIKKSMNESMKNTLPYDHIVIEKGIDTLDGCLKNNKSIKELSKFYTSNAKVIDSNIKYKGISINEVKEEDYCVKYKILEGEDIFQGSKNEILISNKYSKANKLQVNDYMNVETLEGTFQYRIKGIYEGGEFNSQTILKAYDGMDNDGVSYLIKSNNNKWLSLISENGYVISINTLSNSISSMLNKVFIIFRYLCLLCIFSSLLFNINIVYMDYIQNKKDEAIIVNLCLGKKFYKKYQLFKIILVVITSTVLSFGMYYLVLKLSLKVFLNTDTSVSIIYFLISFIIAIILSVISFNLPLRNLNKKLSYELLKE